MILSDRVLIASMRQVPTMQQPAKMYIVALPHSHHRGIPMMPCVSFLVPVSDNLGFNLVILTTAFFLPAQRLLPMFAATR